jgi:WXG100 family type VII secretion target
MITARQLCAAAKGIGGNMPADKLRVEFQVLADLAKSFGHEADETDKLIKHLMQIAEGLYNAGWRGRAADKFYREMEELVSPGTSRLANCLREMAGAIGGVTTIYRQADQQVAQLFKGGLSKAGANTNAAGTGGGGGGGGGAGSAHDFVMKQVFGADEKRYNEDKQFHQVVDRLTAMMEQPSQGLRLHINHADDGLPVLQNSGDRRKAILLDVPAKFNVADNPKADGSEPLYELSAMSQVNDHAATIDAAAKALNVDPTLVKAVMYMETTHGYYDAPLDWVGKNVSIRPMNVNVNFWKDLGIPREYYNDPKVNIFVGSYLIREIQQRTVDPDVTKIATLYNNLSAEQVNDYGKRVTELYRDRPWENK